MKKPLGILVQGSPEETMTMVKAMVEKEKPTKLVTVGDRVSEDLTNQQVIPDVLIVDNRVMRKEITPINASADKVVTVRNPSGTITNEAWLAVENAMEGPQRTKIVVEGEEDLLTLAAILTAPEGSLILYGQPHEGIVIVKATAEAKQRVRAMVDAMRLA